jgi:hypothetical protein
MENTRCDTIRHEEQCIQSLWLVARCFFWGGVKTQSAQRGAIQGVSLVLLTSRTFPQTLPRNAVLVCYPVVALSYSNIPRCSDPYEIFCGLPSNINMNLYYELMQFNTRCTHTDLLNHFSVMKRGALQGNLTNINSVLTFRSLIEPYSVTLLQR